MGRAAWTLDCGLDCGWASIKLPAIVGADIETSST